MEPIGVTVRDVPGGQLFTLCGDLDLDSADGLADRLVGPTGDAVVLDLSGLTFMDSSGITAVLQARNVATENGGSLVVTRPQANVHRVLTLMGLEALVAPWRPEWSAGQESSP